jgi:hypothetical protein
MKKRQFIIGCLPKHYNQDANSLSLQSDRCMQGTNMLSGLLNVRSAAAKQAVITAINLLGLNLPQPLGLLNYYVAMFHLTLNLNPKP